MSADAAHLLWNGCKVAIATQGLFEAQYKDKGSKEHLKPVASLL